MRHARGVGGFTKSGRTWREEGLLRCRNEWWLLGAIDAVALCDRSSSDAIIINALYRRDDLRVRQDSAESAASLNPVRRC